MTTTTADCFRFETTSHFRELAYSIAHTQADGWEFTPSEREDMRRALQLAFCEPSRVVCVGGTISDENFCSERFADYAVSWVVANRHRD